MANTTWNPSDKTANITLTGSNLIATMNTSGQNGGARAVDRQAVTGKYYWECTVNTITNVSSGIGISMTTAALNLGPASVGLQVALNQSGRVYLNGTIQTLPNFGALTNGTVVCIALDIGNSSIWFRLGAAGNWNNVAGNNPATGVGGILFASVFGSSTAHYPVVWLGALNDQVTANFGTTAFTGAVPASFTSGFPTPSSPLIGADTQTFLEQWADGGPTGQTTQIFAEQWSSATSVGLQAITTQIFLEQWARVPPSGPPRRPIRTQNVNIVR